MRFTEDPDVNRRTEEQRYQLALTDAGFRAVAGIDSNKGGLQVWPAEMCPRMPRPSMREMAEDWLRALTISSEQEQT